MEFAKESLDQIYAYYFGMPKNIDAVYHRMDEAEPQVISTCAPDEKDIPADDESWKISKMVRNALGMAKNGDISQIFSLKQLDAVRSLLANLVKIKDVQTKKRVLFYFRLLARYSSMGKQLFDNGLPDIRIEVQNLVARVAAVNGIATTTDYYVILDNNLCSDKKKVFNDLVEQAKKDIKSELESDIPQFSEISYICRKVQSAAGFMKLPNATIERFEAEFNPSAIIANGDYVEKFAESIELKRAKIDDEEQKLAWYDKMVQENVKLRTENDQLKKEKTTMLADIALLGNEVQFVRASLLSRGVNNYKKTVVQMVKKYKNNTK